MPSSSSSSSSNTDRPPASAAAYGWSNGVPVHYPTDASPPVPRPVLLPPPLTLRPKGPPPPTTTTPLASALASLPPAVGRPAGSSLAFPKAFDPDRALLYQRAMSRAMPKRTWQAKGVTLAVWLSCTRQAPPPPPLPLSLSLSRPAAAVDDDAAGPATQPPARPNPSDPALMRAPPFDPPPTPRMSLLVLCYRILIVEDFGHNNIVFADVRLRYPPLLPFPFALLSLSLSHSPLGRA